MSEQNSASNIKRIIFTDQEEKVLGRGRIGKRVERFDPNAIDGDNDGTVQEGSNFERPAGPQNMPKVKPIQVPRPEEVPIKPSTPSRPSTPSKPSEIPQKPKVPQRAVVGGAMGLRTDEKKAGSDLIARLRVEKRRGDSLYAEKPAQMRRFNQEISSMEYHAQMLVDGKIDEFGINDMEMEDLLDAVSVVSQSSKRMDERTRAAAQKVTDAYNARLNKKRNSPRGRLAGGIGIPDDNRFNKDDENFGEDILSPEDLTEINDLQDQVLDELADSIVSADDLDNELQQLLDDAQDPNGAKDRRDIEAIQAWLKDHPFNPAARDYEEREWADNESDGQAERYAPIPWEVSGDRKDQINWDKLLRQANLTPQQKEDWELTDEELKARQALHDDKLGTSGKSKAERAQIWTRVKNGEGFREIAPDYPDYHWSLVRDMSRMGATEAGVSKQQSQAAERAARSAARERANNASVERLIEKMQNAKDVKDLKRRLNAALDEAKNIKKRTSNEYQMMRKKQVERWRLASSLFETMPERKDGENDGDFADRMRNWFFETSPLFEQLAEDINHGHDISTATDRAYEFQNDQISMLQDKLSDVQSFWDDIQNTKNKPTGGSGLSGSIGLPRGLTISKPAKAKKVDFREFEAIQTDLAKLNNNSFKSSSVSKRPPNLNKQESAIVSRMRSTKDFPKGFFRPRKKPKKA